MDTLKYDMDQRRLRANRHIRELAATVRLSVGDFIQPLFVDEGIAERTPVSTLQDIHSETIESAIRQIEEDKKKGVSKFLLFSVPEKRSERDFDFGFLIKATQSIKSAFGDSIWLVPDVCLCAYSVHGHCGILNADGTKVLNHETAVVLADLSVQLATERIKRDITPADQARLVDEYLDHVKSTSE